MRAAHGVYLFTALLLAFLSRDARAQAADSAAPAIPDLSGKWRMSRPVAPGFTPVEFVQTGNRLQADIVQHTKCRGRDVVMRMTLSGDVQGRQVRLRANNGQLEGNYGDSCNSAVFVGREDFRGTLAPDGKKIVGPYDASGTPLHTWTFER